MKQLFGPASVLVVLAALAAAGCSSGAASPPALPAPTSAATTIPAPPVPQATAYTATASAALATPSPAPAGQTAAPIAVVLPSGGGVAATVDLPSANASIPPHTSVNEVASNALPPGLPALAFARAIASLRTPLTAGSAALLQVDTLTFSNQVVFGAAPSFAFAVDSDLASLANTAFYVAKYDPLYSSLGWQRGFEGPGTVSGATISFVPIGSQQYLFQANSPQYFALYAVALSASTPTPAPSATAAPTPPPLAASPASVDLLGAGASASVAISDASTTYTGSYTATSASTAVATVAISGKTVTVTGVAAGQTTVTVASSDGRQVIIPVGVTTTSVPVQ